jgi:hypothetical protein
MIMQNVNKEKLARAKKRIEDIKGFYTHLIVYVLVNLFIFLASTGLFTGGNFSIGMPEWGYFTTPFFWGIGLFFHGLWVFGPSVRFLKNWEERKIKEYMDKNK